MDLQKRITAAKSNKYELNNLINEYQPFIAGIVKNYVGHFVEYGNDDELSIGLMAFEEAIKSFDEEKGSFLSFAEGIIKRRLIDYYRKESKHGNVVSISSFANEDGENPIDITEKQSIDISKRMDENELRKYEIIEIQNKLKDFDISFFELVDLSPKHNSTKKIYQDIVKAIINNKEILNILFLKKYLPVAQIEELTKINRKVIERARKYVIALVIILSGDYTYVQSYINWR